MSVLINGTPAGFFQTHQGLRQRDPLPPLLFILVMEALSRLLDKAVCAGLLEGFVVGTVPGVNTHLKRSRWGLRVNLRKSELIPVGEVQRLLVFVTILGYKVSGLLMVYPYCNWPTFPQIFIKGEFIGGSDIILNMHQTGELKEMLKDIDAN
ncbi:monothiol glutaredoxin-S11-like [Camellia sinensis]|uniref:monothiol glutaredoxin-S11-like n=1 Tax=Camellia sinensis TaxID=4442 RepID=UPI0010357CEA|nr:monothiol glutaredoxin-S11-like [Camellia sinensis]